MCEWERIGSSINGFYCAVKPIRGDEQTNLWVSGTNGGRMNALLLSK